MYNSIFDNQRKDIWEGLENLFTTEKEDKKYILKSYLDYLDRDYKIFSHKRYYLYVENEIGVLARISGLFAGKSYNLNSLTVGTTEDESISRMTISLYGDDKSFEQIKKQLNRCIEVIKVVDYSDIFIHSKEILYIRISFRSESDKIEIFRLAEVYKMRVADYGAENIIVECVKEEEKNSFIINKFAKAFPNHIEVVRGGSVAMEGLQ